MYVHMNSCYKFTSKQFLRNNLLLKQWSIYLWVKVFLCFIKDFCNEILTTLVWFSNFTIVGHRVQERIYKIFHQRYYSNWRCTLYIPICIFLKVAQNVCQRASNNLMRLNVTFANERPSQLLLSCTLLVGHLPNTFTQNGYGRL